MEDSPTLEIELPSYTDGNEAERTRITQTTGLKFWKSLSEEQRKRIIFCEGEKEENNQMRGKWILGREGRQDVGWNDHFRLYDLKLNLESVPEMTDQELASFIREHPNSGCETEAIARLLER